MRVLHLYAGNLYGGIETLLVTLARHRGLCSEMEPHFALCFEGRLRSELKEAGVPVHFLGQVRFSRPWTVWRARRQLARMLDEVNPDTVICHECWVHCLFAPVVRSARLPLLFWAHDAHGGRHWLERWARRMPPDLLLANSRFTESTLNRLFRGVPSEFLYNPVSPPPVMDRTAVRRRVRQSLGISENAVVIIQFSRLERWKGQSLLLQSLEVLEENSNWLCWFAGGAQRPHEIAYLAELKQQAKLRRVADRMQFLGQRSDIPHLLAAADIHCQPNLGPEPFGIVFVEALNAGLPVVTTAMGGALEIVDDTCGLLVPPRDVDDLAEALRRLIEDEQLRKKFADAGPARAAALCDLKTQMAALSHILHSVQCPGCAN